MDLTGIISISGKPGLYKVVAQSPKSIIVENLADGKKTPAFASHKISALEDITMYTKDGDDKPLKDIYTDLFNHLSGKEGPSHKDKIIKLTTSAKNASTEKTRPLMVFPSTQST